MGTNAVICMKLENGNCSGVLVTSDGYPEHTLRILKDHYNTIDDVKKIIDGGNLRALYENYDPDPRGYHSLDDSQPNTCMVYRRDILDKSYPEMNKFDAVEFKLEEYKQHDNFKYTSYVYVFDNGEWMEYLN